MGNQNISYTIVATAPQKTQEKFNLLKGKLDLASEKQDLPANHFILKDMAHFAIKRTFYLKDEYTEDVLLSKLKGLSFKPIKIKGSKSGLFETTSYGNVLYVEIDKNQELLTLHNKIKALIDLYIITKNPEYEGSGYIPHLTVVYNLPNKKITEAKSILNDLVLPVEFELDKVYFLRSFNKEKDERETVKIFYSS